MTRSNNRARHSLAVAALAVATLASDVPEEKMVISSPAKAACAEKTFAEVLEAWLPHLSDCVPARVTDLEKLVEDIRRLAYADDDRKSLVVLGENDAMASFAVTLWQTCGVCLYASHQWMDETGANGIPDLLEPSPEGIEAWRHARKRMRKGKFSVA